jgi:hypothetical protein
MSKGEKIMAKKQKALDIHLASMLNKYCNEKLKERGK